MWRLLLGTMGVKSLVQGLNAAATAGFEPRTVLSEASVWRRNRLATAPGTCTFFFFFGRVWNQCEPSKGIAGKKPCTDSSIGSCVRACVTDARATVYVCVHMPKEVYEKEKMCVHAAEDAVCVWSVLRHRLHCFLKSSSWSGLLSECWLGIA